MNALATWWQQRSDSEQRTLAIAAPIIVLAILYLLVFAPLHKSYTTEKEHFEQLKDTYIWLAENGDELTTPKACRSVNATAVAKEQLQRSLHQEGISQAQWSQTAEGWNIVIEGAQGRALLRWLEASACAGASIKHLDIQRQDNSSSLVDSIVEIVLL